MSINQRKKIKLSKVREIIVSRLRDDLRQPTLLKSAIEQGRKERDSALPIFTKQIQPFPQQRFELDTEDPREKNLRSESNLSKKASEDKKTSQKTNARANHDQRSSSLFKPVALSKMLG